MAQLQMDSNARLCIDECLRTHDVVLETTAHCLDEGGAHSGFDHMRAMLDCSYLTQVTADFMMGRSPFSPRLCELTAEMCDTCATSCEEFVGDAIMQECAAQCRRCSTVCRQMATGTLGIAA